MAEFRAMNTDVSIFGGTLDVEPWFREVEATLSRFLPSSPLSQMNNNSGGWTAVPALLLQALQLALEAAAATGGAFDPTVLNGVEAAGYRRSFELGAEPPRAPAPAGRWREIQLVPAASAVYLPRGVRIDLGGLGKGLAVDEAVRRLAPTASDGEAVFVNAGGDIGVYARPGAPAVIIDVADPFETDRTLGSFSLQKGGAATSSILGRRWGEHLHHIIDPTSGRPAETGIVAATVVADRTVWADVLAKSMIVLGEQRGLALLAEQGCEGLLVRADRSFVATPGMEAHFHP
ncbi:MAG TPA: FAD:protein FMN transferase [Symbiobacteriaceae bacterium]|jgi:thiamine biosynthesis lipoprotein|nr:FAD:protein FMN transferase [Symbiobacteriaceae bacterium]